MDNNERFSALVVDRVNTAIAHRGWSQNAVSEQAGIPRTTLLRRLSGATPFSLDELAAVADCLEVDVLSFLVDPRITGELVA